MNAPSSQDIGRAAPDVARLRSPGASPPPRRRAYGTDLLVRFLFFVFQVAKITVLSAGVFVLAAAGAYVIVEKRIRGEEVVVPSVVGMRVEKALEDVHDPRFDLGIKLERLEYSDLAADGEIVSQTPPPGKRVKKGSDVRVRVSRGPTLAACPNIQGINYLEAGIRLRESDLLEGARGLMPHPSVERDAVIAQDPPPGRLLERRSPVNLLVSLGPPQPRVLMPSLAGLTPTEAQGVLDPIGLTIQTVAEEPFEGRDNGLVFRQEPLAGTVVSAGQKVTVTVVNNLGQEAPQP